MALPDPLARNASVDETTLASLLVEVDAPVLQAQVLRLASAAAEGDMRLADQPLVPAAAAAMTI